MTTDARGIYVHVPFCKQKCRYCDFCSYPGLYDIAADAYIDRLISEAQHYKRTEKITADTVYFGGGTPSLLSPRQLCRVLEALHDVFDISENLELTLEANPGTLCEEKLRGYKSLGVNRISLGLQSIHENELKFLGRIHTYEDFLESHRLLRALGFDNIGVDLMYAIPHQTPESFRATLAAVTALAPEHISAYGLIVEEGTPFFDMPELPLPGEDAECAMYADACELLRAAGYLHYEISNYAKPGCLSRHNLKYWHDEEYIGLGAAAYSYFEGRRFGNVRSYEGYMSGAPAVDIEELTADAERFEYAMMRLRLSEGIPLRDYRLRFGSDFTEGRAEKLSLYERAGLLLNTPERVALTERGFYLSNAIMADLL